jgi:hypothetical protein
MSTIGDRHEFNFIPTSSNLKQRKSLYPRAVPRILSLKASSVLEFYQLAFTMAFDNIAL